MDATVPMQCGPAVELPPTLTLEAALTDGVLRLLTVGSKRFLTTKVDRSVSGLVAQQQVFIRIYPY